MTSVAETITEADPYTSPPMPERDRAEVLAFLRDELHLIRPTLPATWAEDALFKSDLGLDSLDLVELVARAEQRCQVYIADADLAELVSLAAMADYLCRQPRP